MKDKVDNLESSKNSNPVVRGKIIKGVGGFYYVNVSCDKIYECKAKGAFRNQKIKPLVGDDVDIEIIDQDKATGNIISILPRLSELIRPAVANCDQAVIIFALADPKPSINLLDRFLIMMEKQDVETMIVFNKCDLVSSDEVKHYVDIYSMAGYKVFVTSTKESSGIEEFLSILDGKTTVLAGPSGVGKSSMLNKIKKDNYAETGEISEKIRRGKHTTRHSELIYVGGNTYVMDTPGFSSLIVDGEEAEDIRYYFREFEPYNDKCRFTGCVHVNEPDCALKDALSKGEVAKERYESYIQFYGELKDRRKW